MYKDSRATWWYALLALAALAAAWYFLRDVDPDFSRWFNGVWN